MENEWQLQDAKNRLSEAINLALTKGPQLITRRGEKTAVLISYAEYEKLCKAQGRLSEFFRESPLAGVEVNRDHSEPREGFTF
jgi:antitoxin Phd